MKYLATDLDGTLLNPKLKYSYVCKANKDALNAFKGNVIIVSGRNQPFVKGVCKEIGVKETFVSANGASIYYKGKEIFNYSIDKKTVNSLINAIKTSNVEYKIVFFDKEGKLYSIASNNKLSIDTERHYKKIQPKTAYITIKNQNLVNKLINQENAIIKMNIDIIDNERKKKEIYDKLISINNNLSYCFTIHSIEVTAKEANKGDALVRLINYMKLNNDDVFVIGDDTNDLPMFNSYKNSFLVSNEKNKHLNNKVLHVLKYFKDVATFVKEEK